MVSSPAPGPAWFQEDQAAMWWVAFFSVTPHCSNGLTNSVTSLTAGADGSKPSSIVGVCWLATTND